MGVVTASSVGRHRVRPARAAEAVEQGPAVRRRLPVHRLVLRGQHRPDLHPARHARPVRRDRAPSRPAAWTRSPRRGGCCAARHRLVVTGGIDAAALPVGLVAQLASGMLSTGDDPARAYLPFDVDACGYVPGEGGAMLVVEERDRGPRRAGPCRTGVIAGYARDLRPAAGPGRPPGACARAIRARAGRRAGSARPRSTWSSPTRSACPSWTAPRPRRSARCSGRAAVPGHRAQDDDRPAVRRRRRARRGDRPARDPRRGDPADGGRDLAGARLRPRPGPRRRPRDTGAHGAGARPRLRRLQLRAGGDRALQPPRATHPAKEGRHDHVHLGRRAAHPARAARAPRSGDALDGDIADVPFADLGYDSLALLEMAAHVQQEYGIRIPDDAIEEMPTPRAAVEYLNRRFTGEPSR